MADVKTKPAVTLVDVLFERSADGLCLVAPDGTVVRANSEWLRSTGFSEEQVVGEKIVGLFPETRDMAAAMHARARAGHRVEVPRHAQVVNGRETWWEGDIEPVRMQGGTGLLITAREIPRANVPAVEPGWHEAVIAGIARIFDEARTIESEEALGRACLAISEALRELEQQSRRQAAEIQAMLDAVPAAVFITRDREARTIEANRFCAEVLRVVTGTNVSKSASEGARRPGFRTMRNGAEIPPHELPVQIAAARGEEVRDYEFDLVFEDGDVRHMMGNATPLRDATGAPAGAVGAFLDITARRRALDALRTSEEQFRLLTEAMPQIVCAIRPDGTVEYVNTAWIRFSGLDQAATERTGWIGVLHPDDVGAALDCRRRVLRERTPQDVELRYRAADGKYRWFLSRLAPVVAGDRVLRLVGAAMDIDGRKRAEEALQASEHRSRSVLENMSEGVMLFDAEGNLTYQNPASLRIHGFAPDDRGGIAHDALPMTWNAWDATGRPITFEEWPVSRVFRKERFQDQVLHVERVETGHTFDGSYNGSPILDEQGRLVMGFITIRDITEQVRARSELDRAVSALRAANEHLRDADHRKDEFLGMLSHELRNPLAPIRNSSYILRRAPPASDQARHAQEVIERQVEHVTRLVDDLLDVTRIARGKIELRRARVDLREVVWRAADDFRLAMDERGVTFRVVLPDTKLWADADATRITQIVGNLLHNASKFTRKGDEVSLALEADERHAAIRVRDTGAGMDPELLPRIFDAFVQGERTLARTDGGLGLGLALVKGITELHGGSVRAVSEGKGKGSEFMVVLPLATAEEPSRGPDGPRDRRSAGRRVLVVDDNRDAAESLAEIVRMLGHSADVAFDGASAIEKVRSDTPDVVLCDLGLPGMSGYEVATALRALEEVQLIAVSGYAQPEDVKRALDAGFDAHIAKPCDPAMIERLLS